MFRWACAQEGALNWMHYYKHNEGTEREREVPSGIGGERYRHIACGRFGERTVAFGHRTGSEAGRLCPTLGGVRSAELQWYIPIKINVVQPPRTSCSAAALAGTS